MPAAEGHAVCATVVFTAVNGFEEAGEADPLYSGRKAFL